eukprot:CAMPEP_0115850390 /NCGR_PEP_ID=MMETSP0287-20121206/11940_1 /TAXON_ID=412157 /ORGANISM="Chrysochromulina rotalis, Strain UIO044" /LENGTH=906 /DNA_ID=CAMNT_0003304387 /DNA_START=42 /DNA_END=2763 /DNA_ORIENTATION=-
MKRARAQLIPTADARDRPTRSSTSGHRYTQGAAVSVASAIALVDNVVKIRQEVIESQQPSDVPILRDLMGGWTATFKARRQDSGRIGYNMYLTSSCLRQTGNGIRSIPELQRFLGLPDEATAAVHHQLQGKCTRKDDCIKHAGHRGACKTGSMAEHEYEIEAILDERHSKKKGKHKGKAFLVKWLNWPEEDATWEPAEALHECTEIIERWHAKQPGAAATASPTATAVTVATATAVPVVTATAVPVATATAVTVATATAVTVATIDPVGNLSASKPELPRPESSDRADAALDGESICPAHEPQVARGHKKVAPPKDKVSVVPSNLNSKDKESGVPSYPNSKARQEQTIALSAPAFTHVNDASAQVAAERHSLGDREVGRAGESSADSIVKIVDWNGKDGARARYQVLREESTSATWESAVNVPDEVLADYTSTWQAKFNRDLLQGTADGVVLEGEECTGVAKLCVSAEAAAACAAHLQARWRDGQLPLKGKRVCTGYSVYSKTLDDHDSEQQSLNTLLVTHALLPYVREEVPGFRAIETQLVEWLMNTYGTVVDLFYAHGLRQGPQTLRSTGFGVHQDTEDYDFIEYTIVVKLTADGAGDPPSEMRVIGARRNFAYGAEAGAAGCFRARCYHASCPPPADSQECLKIAFFFRASSKGDRRARRMVAIERKLAAAAKSEDSTLEGSASDDPGMPSVERSGAPGPSAYGHDDDVALAQLRAAVVHDLSTFDPLGLPPKARERCGECEGCLRLQAGSRAALLAGAPDNDCGQCKFCKDKPKFNGNFILKQACQLKQCTAYRRLGKVTGGPSQSLPAERCSEGNTSVDDMLSDNGAQETEITPAGELFAGSRSLTSGEGAAKLPTSGPLSEVASETEAPGVALMMMTTDVAIEPSIEAASNQEEPAGSIA